MAGFDSISVMLTVHRRVPRQGPGLIGSQLSKIWRRDDNSRPKAEDALLLCRQVLIAGDIFDFVRGHELHFFKSVAEEEDGGKSENKKSQEFDGKHFIFVNR